MSEFPTLLRQWRKTRRLSQLDLALDADVSARHISFLETGRARPSPGMIARLSEVLALPLEARNELLVATGFAPRYGSTPLSGEAMAPVVKAVRRMLDRHAPYPAMALNRLWRIEMLNEPAAQLFGQVGLGVGGDMLALLRSPAMAQMVENWPEVAYHSATRLRAESVAAGGIRELDAAAHALAQQAKQPDSADASPVIPVRYRLGDMRLSLFGTIAQFSTIADTTLDDLKIELFFPADDPSADALQALFGDAAHLKNP